MVSMLINDCVKCDNESSKGLQCVFFGQSMSMNKMLTLDLLRSVDFSPDDTLLVTASSSDNSGRIWDLERQAP